MGSSKDMYTHGCIQRHAYEYMSVHMCGHRYMCTDICTMHRHAYVHVDAYITYIDMQYTYINMHAFMCTLMSVHGRHAHVGTCMHVQVCIYSHVYVHIEPCMDTQVHAHIYIPRHVHTCVYVYVCVHVCEYAWACTFRYTCMDMHTETHTITPVCTQT